MKAIQLIHLCATFKLSFYRLAVVLANVANNKGDEAEEVVA